MHPQQPRNAPVSLTADDLLRLSQQASEGEPSQPCGGCQSMKCAGWEAMPSQGISSRLTQVGTLRSPDSEGHANLEPTLDEFHPNGTHYWSKDAPIAVGHFPYNRCDVWQCADCSRLYLRYTEYGGYYQEERIREVNAALIWAGTS